MSKIRLYNKTLALLASGTIMNTFIGCKDNIETQEETLSSTTSVLETTTQYTIETTQSTTLPIITTEITTTETLPIITTIEEATIPEYTTIIKTNEADDIILESFHNLGEIIKQNINSDELLEKGKAYFVFCVDFLFYDGEIKGYTFNDMTDAAKQQLLIDITNIDGLISSKYPNYKETISQECSNAYNKASEIIKVGSKNIKDFSREKLGQENYEKIGKYKDMFMEQAFGDFDEFKDLVNQGIGKIKNWYEGLR